MPLEANAPPGYIERYIHSEIYKMYPAVNSIVHSHASAAVPYRILDTSTPVYDVAEHYQPDEIRDLLIRSVPLGQALASSFSKRHSGLTGPDHAVVFMRGHGSRVVPSSIEDCIFRANYTKENALIQTTSLGLRNAYHNFDEAQIQHLHYDEIEGTKTMGEATCHRPWGLQLRGVEDATPYGKE
ncbi:uncharacterized protein A1O5_10580 [Cladophialophora psammophila CBS 110553]|uniref:Class II aldolase/adducin N-terminal domain-containing protein n=1 Tax=Cladophialophora psammophila CBS 110553 TaxID=1182543 RepID=W9WET2_9EURO|nr:uncharacterized protein A1O5_10580 [Cladophialophora psammophila CBS 110553]EXJ66428.1 hypothetical protein A1O5_10580 [Cladophialophora psammophila CBS 110553]